MSDVRITLVRHGESVSNSAKRWQGQSDSPLSELGRAQARALAARLADRTFDLVVTSDLSRAHDTARALGRPCRPDPSFREFDVGAWEGLTREEVMDRYPDELARLAAGEDVALGGGESFAAFSARIDAAIARLRSELAPGQHALVVCHGGVIGAVVAWALGLRGARRLPIARPFNTSITELAFAEDGGVTLHTFNDSLHLASLPEGAASAELSVAVALICDSAPAPEHGAFAAHYDERAGAALGALGPPLQPIVERLRRLHPEGRLALTADAPRIRDWASAMVWPGGSGAAALELPICGSLCHVHVREGQLALIDYGVRPAAPAQAASAARTPSGSSM